MDFGWLNLGEIDILRQKSRTRGLFSFSEFPSIPTRDQWIQDLYSLPWPLEPKDSTKTSGPRRSPMERNGKKPQTIFNIQMMAVEANHSFKFVQEDLEETHESRRHLTPGGSNSSTGGTTRADEECAVFCNLWGSGIIVRRYLDSVRMQLTLG